MHDLISIVIPVYNAAEYLKECLDSIIKQTYSNFEVLLINDGSRDRSEEICKEYCSKDARFILFSIDNNGPSYARNYAIERCSGKLVTYIDSDDYVDPRYLERLIDNKEKYDADISVVGLVRVESYERVCRKTKRNTICFSGSEAIRDMLYQKHLDTSPCAILFDKEIAKSNPFPVGRYHEDDFTMYKYYECVKKVVVDTEKMYFYVQHEGSIMHSNGKINYDELDAADNLVLHFRDENQQLYRAAISKKFSDYCQVLIKCPEMETVDEETYNRIVSFLKQTSKSIRRDKNTRAKNKVAAFVIEVFGEKCLVNMSKIVG